MIKYILPALILGVAAGYLNSNSESLIANCWVSEYLFTFALVMLLFMMGFTFGLDKEAISKMRRAGLKILVFPFAIALGSVLGGLVGGYLLGVNIIGSMAVSSGFGWYTLTGPLAEQFFGAEFGALGFSANFLRELLTILATPLIVKFDKHMPVAFGGATAMDTTLPVIVRYCGSEMLIIAFSSGFILSILAPITITAISMLA
jgi:uncharacterized membrane protein YbjE (DUF340 family)